MHENIGALKQNTVSIKNNSLSGYSRYFPVLRNVFIKFLYFPGYIHLDISPLQKKISFYVRKSFYTLLSLSLSLSLSFLAVSFAVSFYITPRPDFYPVPGRRSFNFSRKAARISTFRLAAFLLRGISPRDPTFLSLVVAGSAVCSDIVPDHPNIYEMHVAEPRRRRALSGRFPRGVHIKGTYSRVSSTLFNVYVSRRG